MDQDYISVGKITGAFGIKGWVKVFSFTEPRENILDYSPWLLRKQGQTRTLEVLDGVIQGKSIVAQLSHIADRDMAVELMGWEVFITAKQLPEPGPDEYYWSDLIGLTVETISGQALGVVDGLLETGSNDVVIVRGDRERAIPFLQGQTIISIDLDAGRMIVDWDPEF